MTDLLAPLLGLPGSPTPPSPPRRTGAGAPAPHQSANWPVTAAESAIRGARSSSALDGGAVQLDAAGVEPNDPVLAGALRVGQALEGGATTLVGVWQRAPLQALARLHAGWRPPTSSTSSCWDVPGRTPKYRRGSIWSPGWSRASAAPAPVLAAVVHGELLTLAPFGSGDGVIARAVSRLVTIATGLDPHGLGVPEVYWLRRAEEYRTAAAGFATGTPRVGTLVADVLSCARRRCAGGGFDRRGRRIVGPGHEAGGDPNDSARRPLARSPGYQACNVGCVGWPRRSCVALRGDSAQGVDRSIRFSQ